MTGIVVAPVLAAGFMALSMLSHWLPLFPAANG
jgi:hypothetical protein